MVYCWNDVLYAVKQSCRFFKIPFFPCYEGFSLNLTAKRIRLLRDFQYCDAYTVIFFYYFFLVYLTYTSSVIFLLHMLIHVYYCFPSLFSITPTFPESKWFRLPTLIVESVNYLSIPDTCQLLTLNAALGATFPVKLYSHGIVRHYFISIRHIQN